MNLNENLTMKGELTVVVRNESGEIKNTFKVPNLVVTSGKNYIASRMAGTASSVMSHMAIGTGSVAPVVGNTVLGSEVGRVALGTAGGTASNNTVTYTATFPAGTGTGGIQEAAILNAASSGTMLCRTTFPVVNKAAGDSIAITWVITVS